MGTLLEIVDPLYTPKAQSKLLSFKDIHINEYQIETMSEGSIEYLQITSNTQSSKKNIVEKLPTFSTGQYYTTTHIMHVWVYPGRCCVFPKVVPRCLRHILRIDCYRTVQVA